MRLTEAEIDAQMLALFDKLRVEDEEFRNRFREELHKATNWDLAGSSKDDDALKKRHTGVVRLQGQLLNLRLLEEIDADTYAAKPRSFETRRPNCGSRSSWCSRGRKRSTSA